MKPLSILLLDISRTSLDTSMDMLEYPLGLLYVGTVIQEAFGERVDLHIESYDARANGLDAVETMLREYQPVLVGLRALTMGRRALHDVAILAKKEHHVPYVIAGGPHATDAPSDVMGNAAFDAAVIGEGERTAVDLVGKILDGRRWDQVAGLAVRNGSGITFTPPRPPVADIDDLPLPNYRLMHPRRFSKGHIDFSFRHDVPHANLLTSRGCPYQCLYCHQLFGKRFRAHSADRVLAEITMLHEHYGITCFQIIDDIFNQDRARALEICNRIIRSGMKLQLSFPNGLRGDRMDPELIDAMWEAGVRYISYAIESGSSRIQRLIRKNLDLERIAQAITLTTKRGMVTRGYFMLGFPTETEDDARLTLEFAKNSDLMLALFFTVVYFPGTPLAQLAAQMGKWSAQDLELEDDYVHTRNGPYEFPRSTLEALKLQAVREFYFSPRRIALFFEQMPNFFAQRDMDAMMMATIISARLREEEVPRSPFTERLHPYFLFAERFSKRTGFYV